MSIIPPLKIVPVWETFDKLQWPAVFLLFKKLNYIFYETFLKLYHRFIVFTLSQQDISSTFHILWLRAVANHWRRRQLQKYVSLHKVRRRIAGNHGCVITTESKLQLKNFAHSDLKCGSVLDSDITIWCQAQTPEAQDRSDKKTTRSVLFRFCQHVGTTETVTTVY